MYLIIFYFRLYIYRKSSRKPLRLYGLYHRYLWHTLNVFFLKGFLDESQKERFCSRHRSRRNQPQRFFGYQKVNNVGINNSKDFAVVIRSTMLVDRKDSMVARKSIDHLYNFTISDFNFTILDGWILYFLPFLSL